MAYDANTTQQPITLTTTEDKSDIVVFAKRYDSHSRFIRVILKDYYGKIPIDSLVQMNAIRPNGLYSFIGGIVEETGALRFGLTTQVLSEVGQVTCDVSVYASAESQEVFTADGVTNEWELSEKFYRLYKVKINGEETNDWTYNNKTFTLTLDTAPADGDTVLIEGLGSLVLTSQEFYIEVVESNNPLVDISKENEFTTITVLLSHIYDLLDDMEGYADRAHEYEQEAARHAQDALDNKNLAFTYKEEAQRQAELAGVAAQDADEHSDDAEAWAVGTKKGVPVNPGAPQYDNSAKDWAEKAEESVAAGQYFGFYIDDEGELWVVKTPDSENLDFRLDLETGHLEVVFL